VWGVNVTAEVEQIHIKCCKQILGVKRQTPNAAVLGELGRFPMAIKCKEMVLKLWITFLKSNESPIHNLYILQFNETVSDPNCNNWAIQVKRILDDMGCTDDWLHQSNMGYNF
jgi:hypothetical protein